MSAVVLRCPACGTTQGQPGECDACYGERVRYFCTHHSTGLWLDDPVCQECGAKFGETSPSPPTPPRRAASSTRRRTRAPETWSPAPRRSEPARHRPSDPETAPAGPSLADILARILAARWRRAGHGAEDDPGWESASEFRLPTFPLRGCIVRLVWLALVLFALAVLATFLIVGGALQIMDGTVGVY